MTATAAQKPKFQDEPRVTRGYTTFIPLLLGVLMFASYYFLPFVTQPELGATIPPGTYRNTQQ
jgi:hypothetical protein